MGGESEIHHAGGFGLVGPGGADVRIGQKLRARLQQFVGPMLPGGRAPDRDKNAGATAKGNWLTHPPPD